MQVGVPSTRSLTASLVAAWENLPNEAYSAANVSSVPSTIARERTGKLGDLGVVCADGHANLPMRRSACTPFLSGLDSLQEIEQAPLGEADMRGVPVHRARRLCPTSRILEVERVDELEGALFAAGGVSVAGSSAVPSTYW